MTTTDDNATQLRDALVDSLVADGTVTTPAVEAALRAIPRHLYVPDVPVEQAYADDAVYTKRGADGAWISAASQPTVVALMLEQLQAQPGETILEAGAGTGYNASLLATLVGPTGRVITIDVDQDIVDGANRGLAAAGVTNVDVILGDGAAGHTAEAPYDRIIATVGTWDMPRAWVNQLAQDGRLVVPLRIRGSVSRSIVFQPDGDILRSATSTMSTFMPLRDGIANDPRQWIDLTPDGAVSLQTNLDQDVDPADLDGLLDTPSIPAWSEVTLAGNESFDRLDVWLTCALPGGWSRMTTTQEATAAGIVSPQFGWGSWATTDKNNLAYLTLRPATPGQDGSSQFEVGVIGHGPDAEALARRVVDQIRTWDQRYRGRDPQFAIAPNGTPIHGQFVLAQPNNQLAITWR